MTLPGCQLTLLHFRFFPILSRAGLNEMKTSELASLLEMDPRTIRGWAKQGRIPGARATKGGHYYFDNRPAFNQWLNAELAAIKERKATARSSLHRLVADAAWGSEAALLAVLDKCHRPICDAFRKYKGFRSLAALKPKTREALRQRLALLVALYRELGGSGS